MIRYEASLSGNPVIGEPFTDFNELSELINTFSEQNIEFTLVRSGTGGYYLFDIVMDAGRVIRLHLYLKRITFGGRETRPYEKRAQFSGSLDRSGFEINPDENEYSIILGIYKSSEFDEKVYCAWKIDEWGQNEGRAFNCFVNVITISAALRNGFASQFSANKQTIICFQSLYLKNYLRNPYNFEKQIEEDETEIMAEEKTVSVDYSGIPLFNQLFEHIVQVLKNNNGVASLNVVESDIADLLQLSFEDRTKIHNKKYGKRTKLGYRLAWALFYLKRDGILFNPSRGIWELSSYGWSLQNIDYESILSLSSKEEVEKDIEDEYKTYKETEIEDVEQETEEDSISIEDPFDPNLVDIRTRTMSLDLLIKRLRNHEIDMNTDFQRQANLWNVTKQSRLIESILVRFPLPAFYFDGSDDDLWLVVDGLQRLSSLDNFVNKESFVLHNLEFLRQFEGLKFSQLPNYLKRRIEEFEITAYVIAAGTPKILKFNVFKRINTGGLTLTSQEIRNALNQGLPAKILRVLAVSRYFKEATCFAVPTKRMLDQEFVLRFIAFYLTSITDYRPDLDSFLNDAMSALHELETEIIEKDFYKAMKAARSIFGEDAFRKRYDINDKRKPINKALFEVWSVLLSRCTEEEISILILNKDIVVKKFINLLNKDEYFNKSISSATGDRNRVKKRFIEIEKIINQIFYEYK